MGVGGVCGREGVGGWRVRLVGRVLIGQGKFSNQSPRPDAGKRPRGRGEAAAQGSGRQQRRPGPARQGREQEAARGARLEKRLRDHLEVVGDGAARVHRDHRAKRKRGRDGRAELPLNIGGGARRELGRDAARRGLKREQRFTREASRRNRSKCQGTVNDARPRRMFSMPLAP